MVVHVDVRWRSTYKGIDGYPHRLITIGSVTGILQILAFELLTPHRVMPQTWQSFSFVKYVKPTQQQFYGHCYVTQCDACNRILLIFNLLFHLGKVLDQVEHGTFCYCTSCLGSGKAQGQTCAFASCSSSAFTDQRVRKKEGKRERERERESERTRE